jgi:hypothetical protein
MAADDPRSNTRLGPQLGPRLGTPRPNELSGQVRPNTLAMPGRPGGTTTPPFPGAVPAAVPATGGRAEAPARARSGTGGRSLSVLVFLAVVAFNVFRLFGFSFDDGSDAPTTAPRASISEPSAAAVRPGPVEFGTGLSPDCELTGRGTSFPVGSRVWWVATLALSQAADAKVVWYLTRGTDVLESDTGPSDTGDFRWSVLCAGEPFTLPGAGTYTMEIWDSDDSVRLSSGEFRIGPAPSP